MNLPIETKPALWGVAGGAIAMAVIGFTWGGWVTGSRSVADATQRAGYPPVHLHPINFEALYAQQLAQQQAQPAPALNS